MGLQSHGDGSIKHNKARFVARGFDQKLGAEYDETCCPVFHLGP